MAYYGVTTSEGPVDPDHYSDMYETESQAQAAAVEYAKADVRGATYYVHTITAKVTFKASVIKTVSTEVVS